MGKEERQQRARMGWEPPGPVPPGGEEIRSEEETLDALCGHWKIFQLKKGHRYSTDDLLGAWFAWDTWKRSHPKDPGRILDLGTGIGSIGLMLAWRFPASSVLGVEKQARSAELARRSVRFNGIEDRMAILDADLRTLQREDSFELITGSPPYWDVRAGVVSDLPQKGPCRFEETGRIEDYCRSAQRLLAPGGLCSLVFDGRQRERAERAALDAGFSIRRLREVISREGDSPLIMLMSLTLGQQAPWKEEPPLLLRDRAGVRSEEFRALRADMGFPPGLR